LDTLLPIDKIFVHLSDVFSDGRLLKTLPENGFSAMRLPPYGFFYLHVNHLWRKRRGDLGSLIIMVKVFQRDGGY